VFLRNSAVCVKLQAAFNDEVIFQELTDTIVITGRLPPENVYQYLIQIRNCPSSSRVRDVVVLAFSSGKDHRNK